MLGATALVLAWNSGAGLLGALWKSAAWTLIWGMPVGVLIAASRSMELGFVPLVLVGFVALYTLLFFRTPATFQRKAVVDLESGEQWSVAAQGSLWRGWPDNDGRGVSLIELQGDGQEGTAWPQQKTSCACRWCGMFALSYGVYGWSGPEFELVHVDGEGERLSLIHI